MTFGVAHQKMLMPTFPLTANFILPSEQAAELSTAAVADTIRDRYPDAIVDWEQGRQKMAVDLQRLIDMGCPEVIYRGQQSLLDKTIFVKIAVEGTQSHLSGYTFGFSHYDGCISLECEPFDVNALIVGARRFANDLQLDCRLCAGEDPELGLTIVAGSLTPQELIEQQYPDAHFDPPSLTLLDDWQTRLTQACRDWLRDHSDEAVVEKWVSVCGTGDTLAKSLIARIESIGPVLATTKVYFGDGQWHSSWIIEYADWTGILNLAGASSPLLG